MALDVGVVQIDYSQARPVGAAYQYAWELMAYDLVRIWMAQSVDQIVQLLLKPVSLAFKQGNARQDEVSLAAVRY